MSIASNFNFLSDIKDIIGVGEIYKNGNIHILSFSKIEDVIKFGNYLIKECELTEDNLKIKENCILKLGKIYENQQNY